MKKQLKRSLWLICCLCAMYTLYSCKQETTAEMKLWYNRPATNWMKSALPIGNGELGAMFFGGISHEHLQFNEKSLWSGSPELRGAYQSFGDVFLDFEGIDSCEVENYYRELSLDDGYGVCTDVVAFALKNAGYDLQALVDADIREHPQWYDIRQPDANIDFRRVRNLKVFFAHHAVVLTTDVSRTEEWQGGDLVIFENHIGIVSDRRNKNGVPYIIHHNDPWQAAYEQDILEKRTDIVGHYRISE